MDTSEVGICTCKCHRRTFWEVAVCRICGYTPETGHLPPPPSREPGQADAALEADIAVFLTEMGRWNNPPRTAALTVRVIADRTRDRERIVALVETLGFYANPGTYFAIGFFPDPPCGDFAADTSETHLGMKPGKRSRALLLDPAHEVQAGDYARGGDGWADARAGRSCSGAAT